MFYLINTEQSGSANVLKEMVTDLAVRLSSYALGKLGECSRS